MKSPSVYVTYHVIVNHIRNHFVAKRLDADIRGLLFDVDEKVNTLCIMGSRDSIVEPHVLSRYLSAAYPTMDIAILQENAHGTFLLTPAGVTKVITLIINFMLKRT